jgi:hypothetical protein
MSYPSEAEARVALHGVERTRQRVIDQIGMPWWYWWGLAACWVGLGVLSDSAAPWWAVSAATLAVGAVHASVSQRLLGGRQKSAGVRVRADVVGRRAAFLVVAFLLGLVVVTIAAAFGLDADGARHPATWASVYVALIIVLGGPRVMTWIRDDATRRATSE